MFDPDTLPAPLARDDATEAPADRALREAAEAALGRDLPLDSWFLYVSARGGAVGVSGLARTAQTAERVRAALEAVPGVRRVELDLLGARAGWPRGE